MRQPPDRSLYRYVVGLHPLRIAPGDDRQPGAACDEVFGFTRRRQITLLSSGRVQAVPRLQGGIDPSVFKAALKLLNVVSLRKIAAFVDVSPEDMDGLKQPELIELVMTAVGATRSVSGVTHSVSDASAA